MDKQKLIQRIYKLPYDYLCQDIEPLDIVGHSQSYRTWNLMKDMYNWKGKNVADLGCFHGYYCFKIEQMGASNVVGYDRSPMVLTTTQDIRDIQKSNIHLVQWELGQPVSKAHDIALLISVLYFAKNEEQAIQNIQCKYLLCDVTTEEVPLIEKYYYIWDRKVSWGAEQRKGIGHIMLCERKHYNESN